jgi:hypothetical protein
MPADAPAITPQPPHYGIDFARASSAVPDGVSSYRVLLTWGVVVTLLLFAVSNLGMLTGLPGWWLVPALMVIAVSGWLVVSLGAQFVARVRSLGRGRGSQLANTGELEVPQVGNVHARLRVIGKPADIARVMAHVSARQRFEPVIVRPGAAASFPRASGTNDVDSSTKLAVPWWKRMVLFAMAALLVWGLKKTGHALNLPRSDFGLLEIAVVGALGIAAAEWLAPTFLRIVPRRLDVMTFVPPGLGRGGKAETICRQYALERATIVVDVRKGAARVEDALRVRDGSRIEERVVYVRAGSLLWRDLEQEARVWGALLSAALSHVEAPELPVDRLVE